MTSRPAAKETKHQQFSVDSLDMKGRAEGMLRIDSPNKYTFVCLLLGKGAKEIVRRMRMRIHAPDLRTLSTSARLASQCTPTPATVFHPYSGTSSNTASVSTRLWTCPGSPTQRCGLSAKVGAERSTSTSGRIVSFSFGNSVCEAQNYHSGFRNTGWIIWYQRRGVVP